MKTLLMAAAFFLLGRVMATADQPAASPAAPSSPGGLNLASLGGTTDVWLGCERHLFKVDGCDCWLVVPKTPLPGNHWAWSMMFPDAFTDRVGVNALLAKGYYYAFMSVGDTFGAPSALDHLDKFYQAMTGLGLKSKVALIGVSRGGLYAYNWATRNPEKVSVIYGDAPVCNFSSWPYAHDSNAKAEWAQLLSSYGYKTDEEGLQSPHQPIHETDVLLKAHIPLISVVGDADTVVPYPENTALIEADYKKAGGEMIVLHKPGCNHHPHGLDDPTPTVDFIVEHDR